MHLPCGTGLDRRHSPCLPCLPHTAYVFPATSGLSSVPHRPHTLRCLLGRLASHRSPVLQTVLVADGGRCGCCSADIHVHGLLLASLLGRIWCWAWLAAPKKAV